MAKIDGLAAAPANRPAGGRVGRAALQVRVEGGRAHAVGPFVDLDELGLGAGLADALDRGDEGVRDGHDSVTRAHPRGHQREADGVGPVRHAHAVLGAAKLGELLLEAVHLGAADETGGVQGLAERLDKVVLEFTMGRDQIEERNRVVGHINAPGYKGLSSGLKP
jgi:hypothetical protein